VKCDSVQKRLSYRLIDTVVKLILWCSSCSAHWRCVDVAARRSAPPLDVVGLPGYERLSDSEKQVSLTGSHYYARQHVVLSAY